MSTLKKLLLSLMVLGAISTTIGAGTFASFTGSTTNASSTFATGSIVLSDTKPSGTACVSAGGSNETTATVPSANSRSDCDVLFDATTGPSGTATSKRPGESTSLVLTLKNLGSVSSTLKALASTACSTTAATEQPSTGTSDACDTVQLSIAETATSKCFWGDNIGTSTTNPFITGSSLSFASSTVITAGSNDQFKLVVDGTTHAITLTAGTYASAAALASQVNGKISTWATAAAVGNSIRITSLTATGTSNVTVNTPVTTPSASALYTLGFLDGSTAAGPGKCATGTGDTDHTLSDFFTTTNTNGVPVDLGTSTTGQSRDITITLSVPSRFDDMQLQGRRTTFDLTWQLT